MQRGALLQARQQLTKTHTLLYCRMVGEPNLPPNAPTHLRALWNSLALHDRGTARPSLVVALGAILSNASCLWRSKTTWAQMQRGVLLQARQQLTKTHAHLYCTDW